MATRGQLCIVAHLKLYLVKGFHLWRVNKLARGIHLLRLKSKSNNEKPIEGCNFYYLVKSESI